MFAVPYTPGILKAVGVRGDREVAESILRTSGKAAQLRLTPDRTTVHADGQDLSFVTVEAVDTDGRFQPNADGEIEFAVSGPGVIAAVGNGDGKDESRYQGDRRKLFQGRALVVVRTAAQGGTIQLTAKSAGLAKSSVSLEAKPAASVSELR